MDCVIWKYPLASHDSVLSMPKGAMPLCTEVQFGKPCVWALVEPAAPKADCRVVVIGTGHPLPAGEWQYVGTLFDNDLGLVWHVLFQAALEVAA